MDGTLRNFVLLRDGGCVARFVNSNFQRSRWPMMQGLPDPGECKNMFGSYDNPNSLLNKTIDHVEDADKPNYAGKPPDDPEHLWTLCHHHHIESNWATKHEVREAARAYIAAANAEAKKRKWPPYPETV